MRYEFEVVLPDDIRLISILCRHDSTWSVTIAPTAAARVAFRYDVRSAAFCGYGTSVETATANALIRYLDGLEEAKSRPAFVPGTPTGLSSSPSVDEIMAQLIGKKGGLGNLLK